MIETHDLCKQFDDFLAVDSVNLNIDAGEVLALLGPNGAGKTTTVRMLTSILRPTRGWARIAGYDVVAQPNQVRASVGVLTEQHGLYERMPADDYLNFFGQVYSLSPAIRQKRINQLLETFGLFEYRRKRIGEFSKGMRQKLALARALMHDPVVLLLDEPTSAMDPESARLVRDAIHQLRSAQRTILICSHNLAEAEELADKIAIIEHGHIIASGTPLELKDKLLGPAQYELHLAAHLNGRFPALPACAALVEQGADWLRFQVNDPLQDNPDILHSVIEQGYPVVSLQEVPRTLEEVYLKAMSALEGHSAGKQPSGENLLAATLFRE